MTLSTQLGPFNEKPSKMIAQKNNDKNRCRQSLGCRQQTMHKSSLILRGSFILISGLVIIGCVAANSIVQQETQAQQVINTQQQNQIQIQTSNNSPAENIPITDLNKTPSNDQQILQQQQQHSQQQQQATNEPVQSDQITQHVIGRQARAEGSAGESASTASASSATTASSVESSKSTSSSQEAAKKESTTTTAQVSSQKKQQSASKSNGASSKNAIKSPSSMSNGKPRLQANLGSTILQGSVNQMSKHDAYSAIAEKHGALAQDAMRRSDKRRIGNGGAFGPAGIQKASGLGDIFNPVRQMSDGGLARTLGASMRSMMKSKYSVPAYVASALLGAVALMAFYESPISPLPVPPLPEAPAGRFPPEMPNLPPGTQVPFRYNYNQQQQQQPNYNQRSAFGVSSNGPMQMSPQPIMNNQQQQVFFPASNQQQGQAQQRSQSGSSPTSAISQVASNLLNAAKNPSQVAQRKSGSDFESGTAKLGALFNPIKPSSLLKNANGQQNASPKSSPANAGGFLSYLGFGATNNNNNINEQQQPMFSQQSLQNGFNPLASNQIAESKSQPSGSQAGFLSKFRSYFSGSSSNNPKPAASSPSNSLLTPAANSPSESSYNRINFIQALMKDASNSLPKFLTNPTNKKASPSSSTNPTNGAVPVAPAANSIQAPSSNLFQANSQSNSNNGAQMIAASSRSATNEVPAGKNQPQKGGQASGFMKVAHALLDSFSSGITQRNAISSNQLNSVDYSNQLNKQQSNAFNQDSNVAELHPSGQQVAGSPLQMASMVVSDLLSNYPSPMNQQQQQQQSALPAPSNNIAQNQQDQQANFMVSPQNDNNVQMTANSASQHPSSISQSSQPESPIARSSSDTADIVIASDDASSLHNSNNNNNSNQVTYSTSVQSQSQSPSQAQLQHGQVTPQKHAVVETSSPISNVNPNVNSQHVRKTRSVGPDFEPASSNQFIAPVQQASPSRAAQINAIVDYVADSYTQNKMLINFLMKQVGLTQAVPYVEQILASGPSETTSSIGSQWN